MIDAVLHTLAAPQLGLITVQGAAAAGVARWALESRRANGVLEYVVGGVMRFVGSPATDEQRLLAANLAVPGSELCGTSSAVVHGMPVPRSARHRLMVAVTSTRSARTPGVTTVRQKALLPCRPWYTGRIATPASTLLLLPRFVGPVALERCLDYSLTHDLVTVSEVRRLVTELPHRAVIGRPHLLRLLDARDGRKGHRSGLEQKVGGWLTAAGLGGWVRNFDVPCEGGAVEVDFAWLEPRVALEVSPFVTHGSRTAQARDIERRREITLAGWRCVEAEDGDVADESSFQPTVRILRALLLRTQAA